MKALVLVALLALPAMGQDVPLADAGVDLILTPSQQINVAKKIVACEAERDSLKGAVDSQLPWWVVPVVGFVALGVGIGAGYGISKVVK